MHSIIIGGQSYEIFEIYESILMIILTHGLKFGEQNYH